MTSLTNAGAALLCAMDLTALNLEKSSSTVMNMVAPSALVICIGPAMSMCKNFRGLLVRSNEVGKGLRVALPEVHVQHVAIEEKAAG
jgi:hypothetical protein